LLTKDDPEQAPRGHVRPTRLRFVVDTGIRTMRTSRADPRVRAWEAGLLPAAVVVVVLATSSGSARYSSNEPAAMRAFHDRWEAAAGAAPDDC
jgi:hypothetical protein